MENSSAFGVADYFMFIGMLLVSVGIGLYSSYIGNKSPEEFLMGNRSLKPLPVAMSLMTTYVSSISLLGFTGEVYANGMQVSMIIIGAVLGIIFSMCFVVPILYPLKLTSITEYIQLRFKNPILSQAISILQLTSNIVNNGVFLYAPTIALAYFANLSYLLSILLLGILCTLYSSFGGIRAVIWTDVFQLTVMIVGLATVVAVGCYQNGGILKTFYISSEEGRLSFLNMNPSPFARHTFINTIAMGFFFYLFTNSCHQVVIQRMCAVKSIGGAKRLMKYNALGHLIIYSLIFTGGLAAFAAYHGCDPMALGKIKKKEDIMPFYITDKINFVPGIAGLFSAALIGACLSSISSSINSIVALMWKDVFLKFSFFQNVSAKYATITNIILSFMVGSSGISLALIFSKTQNLLDFVYTISASIMAPVLGVFLIGFFLPKCNVKGVWAGFVTSTILTLWLGLGGLYYKRPPTNLAFSAEDCLHWNHSSSHDQSKVQESLPTHIDFTEETNSHSFHITDFYQISYTLYWVIGTSSCVLVAVIVSLLTGGQNIEEVSPKYISPSIRRFYWTKEQLKFIYDREISLVDYNVNLPENKEEEYENVNKM